MFNFLYNIILYLLSIDTLYYKINRTIKLYKSSLKFICWYSDKPLVIWRRNCHSLTLKNLIGNDYYKHNCISNSYR